MHHSLINVILLFSAIRLLPHLLIMLFGRGHHVLALDMQRWSEIILGRPVDGLIRKIFVFIFLMTEREEFRNLFYYRAGFMAKAFRFLCPPLSTLYIRTPKIGPGFFIQHGFATSIGAKEIGANFWINQVATVGWLDGSGGPTIGDDVTVNVGARVLGNIEVGANSRIGANAVVIKSIPPNCTVVGVPARIVKRDGFRVDEKL